jgi:hypothetical protein
MIAILAALAVQGAPTESLLLADRTEMQGTVESVGAGGILLVRLPGGPVRKLAWEEIVRVRFPEVPDDPEPVRGPEQVQFAHGAFFHGRLETLDAEGLRWSASWGRVRVLPGWIRSLSLGTLPGSVPEFPPGTTDVLLREVERREEGRAQPVKETALDVGRLVSIGPGQATFEAAEGGRRELPRASVRRVVFREPGGGDVPPPGLYVRVRMRDGSRWSGILEGASPGAIRIFSVLTGSLEIARARLHSIAFVQQGRVSDGNLLVAESNGIREFDRLGRETWRYREGGRMVRMARRLENGNVLAACPQHGEVVEIRPRGKSGGDVVWFLGEVHYPFDAVRLPGGTTVVAEHYGGRVAEYDAQRKVLRSFEIQTPQALERLENGNLLVTTSREVVELDPAWKPVWRANLRGQVRPWRAERLENGNTLITDSQRGLVVEVDAQSNEVWRLAGLGRPVQTTRLEDGNTLILEEGAGRIVEVDPHRQAAPLVVVRSLQGAAGFSVR